MLFFAILVALNVASSACDQNRPVIGILTQELPDYLRKSLSDGNVNATSYFPASYRQFVESGGARVVPIMMGKNEAYYKEMLSYVNGVLFPGGDASLDTQNKKKYAWAGYQIFKMAQDINDKEKQPFPVWGTCLGMELLAVSSNNGTNFLTPCSANNLSLSLTFLRRQAKTKLYNGIQPDVLFALKNKTITANFHHYCITVKMMKQMGLDKYWTSLTTSNDTTGMVFVSSFEAKNYPIFGVQFHPEKNTFEWFPDINIDHSQHAVQFQQFLSNKFIGISRQNSHRFPNETFLRSQLIYNYNPVYTGKNNQHFEQLYVF